MTDWTPASWRAHPALQQPPYAEPERLAEVEARLSSAAPVVPISECRALRDASARLHEDGGFWLQGGDCAENFDDQVAERVAAITDLFDRMAERIAPAMVQGPLIEVARIAGQFAKPRTSEEEVHSGLALPAYRGDIVNAQGFDAASRRADPMRMLRAHMQSVGTAATLAAARDVSRPIFTSHEALLLPYEQALTRRDEEGRYWATSGHMVWLGDRTRQPLGAHVAFLCGIENVVGVKCGPSLTADELLWLTERLDPEGRPGKLILIGRFGAKGIEDALPPLMRAMKRSGRPVTWIIDPMHGNTTLANGRKIRRLPDILTELDRFVAIARSESVAPAGVHLEMSALDVTECLGGRGPLHIDELDRNWLTACDPRLNRAQAIDLAAHLAELLREGVPA